MRILAGATPGQKLPMRRREGKQLHIGCVHKSGDGKFHLSVGENIWGGVGLGELTYEHPQGLLRDGWEID